jgi:hypothetical protein
LLDLVLWEGPLSAELVLLRRSESPPQESPPAARPTSVTDSLASFCALLVRRPALV